MDIKAVQSKYVTIKGFTELALLSADFELVALLRMLSRVESSYTPDYQERKCDDGWVDPCPIAQLREAFNAELFRRRDDIYQDPGYAELVHEAPKDVDREL